MSWPSLSHIMKHSSFFLRILPVVAWWVTMGGGGCLGAVEETSQSTIPRVERMPNLPQPFAMRDWPQVTRDYIDLVLDFEQRGEHLPLVGWLDEGRTMVSFPSYVGGPNDPEAVNYLAAVISGSLVGLEMRNYRGHDWVAMGTNFFSAEEIAAASASYSSTRRTLGAVPAGDSCEAGTAVASGKAENKRSAKHVKTKQRKLRAPERRRRR